MIQCERKKKTKMAAAHIGYVLCGDCYCLTGARSEGVEGFFKGIGKGLLGLLTRPTGGVIDMVSFTLDGIRRYIINFNQLYQRFNRK